MKFNRAEYTDGVMDLCASRRSDIRAVGDNYSFEQNVCHDRLVHFEGFKSKSTDLRAAVAHYFLTAVQGLARSHIPSTFESVNQSALLPATLAKAQKIVRLECIDSVINKKVARTVTTADRYYEDLQKANGLRKDLTVLGPFVQALNEYPGARPAFATFKSEVDADLKSAEWLELFRARTGLGHHSPVTGQIKYFALMEYTVDEVFKLASSVPQPFAVPTVLESQNSAYFFPAPAGTAEGYAVDLDDAGGRDAVREVLHMRMTYTENHILKFGRLVGPTAPVRLSAARDRHLEGVRGRTGQADYGEFMAGKVDD